MPLKYYGKAFFQQLSPTTPQCSNNDAVGLQPLWHHPLLQPLSHQWAIWLPAPPLLLLLQPLSHQWDI